MNLSDYYGRRILVPRVDLPKQVPAGLQVLPTMQVRAKKVRCLRCNSETDKTVAQLPNGQYYCPACINLGRVSTLDRFYHVKEPNHFVTPTEVLSWSGHLSALQRPASANIRTGLAKHERQLLWAVTGAGKTEMMFLGLADCLKRGERVAIASPRVDVCLELYPRLQKAFQDVPIALLHGRSETPYQYRQLTICTTHQLLRFYRAFDNLIVDEVDAFPYAMNPRLLFATNQAVKADGGLLFLTATPGRTLQRQIKHGQLKVTYLPLRYHGHLLPTIHVKMAFNWRQKLKSGHLPTTLRTVLKKYYKAHQRFLLFVPHVADLPPVGRALKQMLPQAKYALVHSADPKRLEKVQQMRDGKLQFLVTTTIMERGVTFPAIDVLVLGADDQVFSTSALVQIAGRAGRSAKRPDGFVGFWCGSFDQRVRAAISQIRQLNQRGARLQKEIKRGGSAGEMPLVRQ